MDVQNQPMREVVKRHGRAARSHADTGIPLHELPVRREAFIEAVQGLRDAYAQNPAQSEAATRLEQDLADFARLEGSDTSDMRFSLLDARGDSNQRRDRLKWGAWGSALVGGVGTFSLLQSRPMVALAVGAAGAVGAAVCHFSARAEQQHGQELARLEGRLNRYEIAFDEAQQAYEASRRAEVAAENYVEGLTSETPSLVEIVLEDGGLVVGDHLLQVQE